MLLWLSYKDQLLCLPSQRLQSNSRDSTHTWTYTVRFSYVPIVFRVTFAFTACSFCLPQYMYSKFRIVAVHGAMPFETALEIAIAIKHQRFSVRQHGRWNCQENNTVFVARRSNKGKLRIPWYRREKLQEKKYTNRK